VRDADRDAIGLCGENMDVSGKYELPLLCSDKSGKWVSGETMPGISGELELFKEPRPVAPLAGILTREKSEDADEDRASTSVKGEGDRLDTILDIGGVS